MWGTAGPISFSPAASAGSARITLWWNTWWKWGYHRGGGPHPPQTQLHYPGPGPEENTLCDGFIVPMEAGDFILLCTDGLVETVTDQEMYDEVRTAVDMDACLQRLLEISKAMVRRIM